MMRFLFVLGMILFLGSFAACSEQTTAERPELLRPVAMQMDTSIVDRGTVAAITRRTGVTRYVSVPVYFEDPASPFGRFHVHNGDFVLAGDLLATLDTRQLDENIENTEIDIARMRSDFAIDAELKQINIDLMRLNNAAYADIQIAQLELTHFQQRQQFGIQRAEHNLNNLRSLRTDAELRAPFDGRITFLANVSLGTNLGIARPIVHMTDAQNIIIEGIDFPNADFTPPGQQGTRANPWIPTPVRNAVQTIGRIGETNIELEYQSVSVEERHMRPVRFIPANDEALTAGQYVSLYFYSQVAHDVLRVPANAVFTGQGYAYVFRIIDNELVHTPITIGIRTIPTVGVTGGLSEGDEVFVRP